MFLSSFYDFTWKDLFYGIVCVVVGAGAVLVCAGVSSNMKSPRTVASLNDRVMSLEAQVDVLKSRIGVLDTELDASEQQMDALNARLDASESRLHKIEVQLNSLIDVLLTDRINESQNPVALN